MKPNYIPDYNFPVKIDKNVYMLGNYFFNLFLVQGTRKTALFEVGISAIVDSVISQLEHLDIQPDFIISSHPHSDHITGLPGLAQRFSKAEIIVAKGAREFIEHPKAGPLLFSEDAFMGKSLTDYEITPGRPPLDVIPDLSYANIIDKNLSLDLGGVILNLEKVEGHSPGNLMGLIPEKKIILCSDSLGFHYPGRGYAPLFFTQVKAYVDALNFINDFKPSIICPAHQGPLMGEDAIKGIEESLDITLGTIKMIQESTLSDKELADKLFKQSYVDEFTLYTQNNIKNCSYLLVKRAKEAGSLL